MRILLASLGTAGDVHPFLAIGRYLAGRGHRVELISSPVFADMAAQAGIAFTGVGAPADYTECFAHHYVWHPLNGLGVMWRYLARRALEASYARIAAVWAEERCVLLYSPFLMPAARIAQEALGVPALGAYTAPGLIRSSHPPVTIAQWRIPRGVPPALCRAAWRRLDRRKMQPLALPDVERLRGRLGLAPLAQSVFGTWLHSPQGGVTLFPAWYAAPKPDWPSPLAQAGFPLYDGDMAQGLSAGVQRFLAGGAAPLVFSAGSAMQQGREFLQQAVAASLALGRRAILMTRAPEQLPPALPATVLHTPYEPFGALLPHACALIHHGGMGSSAQALRAGLPQLVLPHAYDQFDNAMRLERLGVAATLDPARADAARLARRLRRLLGDPRVAAASAEALRRVAADDPLPRVLAALEALT